MPFLSKIKTMYLFLSITFICSFNFAIGKPLIIAGPMANVTHPFIIARDTNLFPKIYEKIEIKQWKNPDELRALIVNNQADIYLLPTNVAATLNNLNIKLNFRAVTVWGILSIVSTQSKIKKLEDLQGEEVLVPFRGDMPDLILQALIRKKKLQNKIKIKYIGTPIEAMQLLLLRRESHVLLAEPATSMAISKTSSFPIKIIAPTLYRAIDLQKEWGQDFNSDNKIPQAGIAFSSNISKYASDELLKTYSDALIYYKKNPLQSAKMVAKEIKLLNQPAILESISWAQMEYKTVQESKISLENFFKVLFELNPDSIGGKMPDLKFYE